MRLKMTRLIAAIGCLFFITGSPKAQNCIPTNINGAVINLACNQVCNNLNFQIPHIKGTGDYVVSSIPYNPFPYITFAPALVLPCTDQDDKYFDITTLPFQFCFYDSVFSKLVISTNGYVSFDTLNALRGSNWSLNTGIQLPFEGTGAQGVAGTCPIPSGVRLPKAGIFGAYCDIFPQSSDGLYKIESRVEGLVPCRKFVVSFSQVPMFGCTSVRMTSQIVLYESTGLIEVFIQNKPACNSNGGLAIVGIQNYVLGTINQKGVTAPGRGANNGAWSTTNEGWRFTPSGPGSRYVRSELYTLTGTLVSTADTITTVAGLLDLSFPNVCPPAGSNQYEVRTTFSSCSNPFTQLVSSDIITVNRTNSLNATYTSTNTACGPPSGTITVNVPAGAGIAPYTFVLDPGPGQVTQTGASPTIFNAVAAGPHTVVVTDASGGCTSTLNLTINQVNNLSANITPNTTSCPGVNNGSIAVVPTNGTAPYTFVLNPGNVIRIGATALYTGLAAGAYSVSITDASGCTTIPALNTTVAAGAGLSANTLPIATTCAGAANGRITVTPTNGTGPFTFVLDGTTTQTGAATTTFNGLISGNHSIAITDANGCTTNPPITVNIASGAILAAIPTETATSCAGASNGTVLISPVNGTAPCTFVLDGTITQTGATTTFINLSAGLHSVVVTDASGCISNPVPVNIAAGPILTTTASHTDVLCNGGSTGSINVAIPAAGTAPYQYSLNNINWQNSNIFPGLIAGIYNVFYRESNGCQNSLTVTVAEPTALAATTSTVPVVCNGQSNGIITVNTGGGVAPYEYSINNGTNWQSNNIFNRPAGLYTITIRDNNNCITTQQVTVTEPAALIASSLNTNASCDGGNDGVIKINALGGNSNYQYSLDGTTFQASDIFNVAPGVYDITIKDNLGCSYVMNTTVGLTNNLTYTPQTNPTICESKSVQLQLTSNATQYSWAPATGLSSTTIANPIANPTVTTRYTVTATLGRCNAADIVTVNVNAAPIPDAGPPGFICYGQTYQLQGSGGVSYTWTPSTYLNSTAIVNPVSNPAKTITYTLSNIIDANGCASLTTDTVTVDVTPPIKVKTFPYDTIAYPGDKFQLLATSGANIYSWTPAAGLSDPNIPDPVVTVGQIGDDVLYQVIASTIAGCKGEGYVRLKVYKGPDIYVPTGFTPNGDGKNDKFIPFPVGIKGMNYFRVFNRWGQIIFSTSNLYDGWDGRINGIEQSTGTYVWTLQGLTLDNRVITKKGTVTLIR
jgi:gliding motility-associated-like protein